MVNSMNPVRNSSRLFVCAAAAVIAAATASAWELGEPVVGYWGGPGWPGHPEKLTDRAAERLREGGFNLAWTSSTEELDVAERHGLRAIYDFALARADVDDPETAARLASRIASVKNHPALLIYYCFDEPPAGKFASLAHAKEWLMRQDPAHAVWVNLLPLYANHRQLGVGGKDGEEKRMGFRFDTLASYWEHVRLFGEIFRPDFLTYDHYQFNVGGDTPNYLLNLAIIRQSAAAMGIPFFNGVQACTWTPGSLASPSSPRIPGPAEMRYLVYTTLAYGAQGIYYYVYSRPGHEGAIMGLDGTPGPNYEPLKRLNAEFKAIAAQLRPFRFAGAYVSGVHSPGTTPWCEQAVLRIHPETPPSELQPGRICEDTTLVTRFVKDGVLDRFMVVNLDYRKDRSLTIEAPAALERFNPETGAWSVLQHGRLDLPGGGGGLLRLAEIGKMQK